MTRKQYIKNNLAMYIDMIKSGKPFCHVKVGDGELKCMRSPNNRIVNIDSHPFSLELSKQLKQSIKELSIKDNVYFADWFFDNFFKYSDEKSDRLFINNLVTKINFIKPFELIMAGWGNLETPFLKRFYNTIAKSKRQKIYVGPERLKSLKDFLKLDNFVEIPLVNAYKVHKKTLNKILDVCKNDSIILISIGLSSPVLINDILKSFPDVTILDVGSGLDSLAGFNTRGFPQATPEQARIYFNYFNLKNYETYSNNSNI